MYTSRLKSPPGSGRLQGTRVGAPELHGSTVVSLGTRRALPQESGARRGDALESGSGKLERPIRAARVGRRSADVGWWRRGVGEGTPTRCVVIDRGLPGDLHLHISFGVGGGGGVVDGHGFRAFGGLVNLYGVEVFLDGAVLDDLGGGGAVRAF